MPVQHVPQLFHFVTSLPSLSPVRHLWRSIGLSSRPKKVTAIDREDLQADVSRPTCGRMREWLGVAWSANSIVAFGAWGSSILFFGDMEVIADSKWSGCNMKFEY